MSRKQNGFQMKKIATHHHKNRFSSDSVNDKIKKNNKKNKRKSLLTKIFIIRGVSIVMFLCLWQMAANFNLVNTNLLPSPISIISEFILLTKSGILLVNFLGSIWRVTLGFLTAVFTGVLLGTILGFFPKLGRSVTPILDIIKPIPPIAWIPLAILWFGLGSKSSIFIIVLGAFFPIFVNTYVGVQYVSPFHTNTARCFGAKKYQIVFDVILPSAMPQIFAGIRIGIGIAWTSVIASEMVGTLDGLGYAIQLNRIMLQTEAVLVYMGLIGVIGFLMNWLVLRIEKLLLPWSHQQNMELPNVD